MRNTVMKLAAALLAISCSNGGPGEPAIITPNVDLALQPIASNLSSPVHLASPPNDDRLFIVEQPGRIRVVQNGSLIEIPFLDINGKVTNEGGEQGLLSVAFHPQYATNRFFYVYYVDNDGNLQIERYTAPTASSNVADPATALPIINIPHPTHSNHNGGQLAFGPDGFLYIGTGDGGSGGDPPNNAQSLNVLLGKILRLDVSQDLYAIPPTNPFRSTPGVRAEIWAYGLRNPWRFSFDRAWEMLYIGDVGQGRNEEINAVARTQAGRNYGWRIMEGSDCYPTPMTPCDRSGLTLPVYEYGTHDNGSCAVTGGFVYRGSAIPQIVGLYFFSDYCRGGLRSFRLVNGAATDVREWAAGVGGTITSFGEDRNRELYVISHSGTVGKLIAAP
ncbi:MAG: PQQ-dependent sugar dehydrogenase [Gemmatimonadaceae bacterium]